MQNGDCVSKKPFQNQIDSRLAFGMAWIAKTPNKEISFVH